MDGVKMMAGMLQVKISLSYFKNITVDFASCYKPHIFNKFFGNTIVPVLKGYSHQRLPLLSGQITDGQ